MKFAEYRVTYTMMEHAQQTANKIPDDALKDRNTAGPEMKLAGAMGEMIYFRWLMDIGVAFFDNRDSTKRDLTTSHGHTIDIKTKIRTVKPRPDFEVNFFDYLKGHQNPDYFGCVQLLRSKSVEGSYSAAYVLGGIDEATVDAVGWHKNKGDAMKGSGKFYRASCECVNIEHLFSNEKMAKLLLTEKPVTA